MIKNFWIELKKWLDPDYDWRSLDKLEHLAGGFGVRLLVGLKEHGWDAILWSFIICFVYECGQADVARSQHLLGKAGYGIGLLDLAYGSLGIFVAVALLGIL